MVALLVVLIISMFAVAAVMLAKCVASVGDEIQEQVEKMAARAFAARARRLYPRLSTLAAVQRLMVEEISQAYYFEDLEAEPARESPTDAEDDIPF